MFIGVIIIFVLLKFTYYTDSIMSAKDVSSRIWTVRNFSQICLWQNYLSGI